MSLRFSTTWQHIRRSPYQALAAVMIMTLTFLVALVFSLLSLGADRFLSYLEKKPEISVYFKDTITQEDQIEEYKQKLIDSGKAVNVRFVTKEEALALYQEKFKDNEILLELVSAKTLPASLEFGATNIADLPALYDLVKDAPDIEEVKYSRDIVADLARVVDSARKAGIVLVGFLFLASLLVVLTVVGMKIALRKEEIGVERLVGGSKWYIRWPFIFEGMFYGLAGAFFAWAVITGLLVGFAPALEGQFSGVGIFPIPPAFHLTTLAVALGSSMIIGSVGSMLAVWRYLHD